MLLAEQLLVTRAGVTVLQDLNVHLQAGDLLGVLGPNGAGKSSLLEALSGALPLSAGRLSLNGRPLQDWPDTQRARHLAVLPQTSTLNAAFKVEDLVALGRLPHATGRKQDQQVIHAALQAMDAHSLQGRNYLQLSGGERQRVQLARVLAQLWPGGPGQVLLLDEPVAALDPLHQHTSLQALQAFAQCGAAVLVILHDLNLAARYCNRLLLLKDGRCHIQGPLEEVLQAPLVKDVFGLEVVIQPHPERDHPLVINR